MNSNKYDGAADGSRYIPYGERTGAEAEVFFTRDLSAQGLIKIFGRVGGVLTGKTGVKLHTDERGGPNIIPRPWVDELIKSKLPGASIIETNTYIKALLPSWSTLLPRKSEARAMARRH